MEIIGDKEFIINTKRALRLIRDKTPVNYDLVLSSIDKIHKNDITFLYPYSYGIYYVGDKISNSDVVLYASCILGEAFHSSLVKSHVRVNNLGNYSCYDGRKNMLKCYAFQFDMLGVLNASCDTVKIVSDEFFNKINYNKSEIKIVGNKDFRDKVKSALNLLKEKDYLSYKTVIQNIRRIIYFPNSPHTYFDRFQEVPTCFINFDDFDLSIYNIACALLHEACHNKLYRDAEINGDKPEVDCHGYSAEMYCLTRQIECLKNIGAPVDLIQSYIEYYDINGWDESNDIKYVKKH